MRHGQEQDERKPQPKQASPIVIKDSSRPEQTPAPGIPQSVFAIIRSAMDSKKLLSFVYKGQRRNVEPYRLTDGGLHAFCLNSCGIRSFQLAFVESPSVLDSSPFEPKWDIQDLSTLYMEKKLDPVVG